jgi:signal transduction histidine kinase/streptogramin lyase
MYEDSRGNFWVGTYEGGVCRLDRRTNTFVCYKQGVNPPDGPIRNDVLAIHEDRSGTIWFGTAGGISSYDPHADKFHLYMATPDDPKGFSNVRSMCESRKGGVWIGLNGGGIVRVDQWGHRLERYRAQENTPHSLSSDKVLSVLEQRDGTLWVGTQGGGLNRKSPNANRFMRYTNNSADPQSLSDNTVIALLEDSDGTVWAGTNGGGLEMFDAERNVFVHHKYSPEPGSISGNWIWSLFEDTKGNIWIGTWTTGLNKFVRTKNRFEVFANNPVDPNGLCNNSILCIREDSAGMLWLGTLGGGLERFDPTTHQFTHHVEKDGLSNNVVLGVLPDRHGDLWISTYRGISRFTPATGAFRNFDVSDGLQSNEFNHGAYCKLSDGTMLFGGIGGLNIFNPDGIKDNTFVPPVVLTAFSVLNAPVPLPQPMYNTERITLSYTQNFFSLDFVALSYLSSNKNEYMYRLEGLEDEWVTAGTRRVAYYTHIPPGTYIFHVRGSNNDGVWNEKGAQVNVVVTPPFWGTWWFRILSSASLVAGLFLLYRRRVQGLEKEKRVQQEFSNRLMESQENERKRIAGELHDSLGQNLLVIRNRALLGLKDTELSKQTRDQLDQISSVSTQAIDEVRSISYDLRPYQLDRLGLTKAIRSITSGLPSSVQFSMDIDPVDDEVGKDQAIHVYRIVQEGINNILKHSGATEAGVVIRIEGNVIRISISDNGKGMVHSSSPDSSGKRGFGLVGIGERAKVLNGTMVIDSLPERGTTLTISIPAARVLP